MANKPIKQGIREIKAGIILYESFLSIETQRQLAREIAGVREQAPFIRFSIHGNEFNNLNTSCGNLGWVVINNQYKYVDKCPANNQPWPAFTPTIVRIAERFKNGVTETGQPHIIDFQSCLINLYKDDPTRGKSSLGLHQDKTESVFVDIVNVSLGDNAIFILGGTNYNDPTQEIILKSGDVLVMRGPGRMCYHGVKAVQPGTDVNKILASPGKGLGIRLSLTLRQVNLMGQQSGNSVTLPEPKKDESTLPQLFKPHQEYPEIEPNNEVTDWAIWEDSTTPEPLPQETQKPIDPRKRTVFTNTVFTNLTSGDIKTVTTLPIFNGNVILEDRVNQAWSTRYQPVVLRNVLLAALHPTIPIGICQISQEVIDDIAKEGAADDINPNTVLDDFKPKGENYTYKLDMASGSRNHGRFTFSALPQGQHYFGESEAEQWKRIIYGSILHTGCRQIRYETIKYIIVDDELKDSNGNLRDDKTNNRHWHTGDSHMKGSMRLFDLVGLPVGKNDETGEEIANEDRPFQIRIGCWRKWVAKGTIAYNSLLDESQWDLVIPLSSLKGNKPAEGNYTDKLFMGVVHEAEERFAKPGWMLWQWFSIEDMEKDGIITNLRKRLAKIRDISNSMENLADFMRRSLEEYRSEFTERDEIIQSEKNYEKILLDVIMADKRGVLLYHPYIIHKITKHLQNMWIDSCTAAGVIFHSVMTMPDESLAKHYTITEDGRFEGRKVFCAPDFPEGKYIVFCNPMRHWGDVQVWENLHEGEYKESYGVMGVPTKLALSLGRDFDGDFVQLINAEKYPNIQVAIEKMPLPPVTVKFPKIALKGNLQEVAIGSMTDKTGIVASLIAQAKVLGLENDPLFLPLQHGDPNYGKVKGAKKQMRIITFLSQQLQIAVDSLKSAFPNDDEGLRIVSNEIKKRAKKRFPKDFIREDNDGIPLKVNVAPWLASLKDTKNVYLTKPADVLKDAPDTISYLVREVNSYWQEFHVKFENQSPRNYMDTLFKDIKVDFKQEKQAYEHSEEYRKMMKKAIESKNANKNTTEIREVNTVVMKWREELINNNWNGFDPYSWVAAYWRASNDVKEGKATLAFTMFHEEIVSELANDPGDTSDHFIVWGVNKSSFASRAYYSKEQRKTKPGYTWTGETVSIEVREGKTHTGKGTLEIWMNLPGAQRLKGFYKLGNLSPKFSGKVVIGEKREMHVYTTKHEAHSEIDGTTEVALIDPKATKARVAQIIKDNARSENKQKEFDYVSPAGKARLEEIVEWQKQKEEAQDSANCPPPENP